MRTRMRTSVALGGKVKRRRGRLVAVRLLLILLPIVPGDECSYGCQERRDGG